MKISIIEKGTGILKNLLTVKRVKILNDGSIQLEFNHGFITDLKQDDYVEIFIEKE